MAEGEVTKKKVVRIGGGSSGLMILRGLKGQPFDITAAVNMFDTGGSSGVLRDQYGVLPPGDVRRALVALSADGKRAQILRDLFNFRFDNEESDLHDHSFGNLFLLALNKLYGSEIEAIRKASQLLNIKGKVVPVSLGKSNIHVRLENGQEVVGEDQIDVPQHDGGLKIEKAWIEPMVDIYEETNEAIREADIVIIGPGDLYSSLVPNLLVKGMHEALQETKGRIVVVCSLMTKWGETHNFKASDFIRELLQYSGLKKFDVVICNTTTPSESLLAKYAGAKQFSMECDDEEVKKYTKKLVKGDFYLEADIARHDSEKIAAAIASL